MNLYVILQHLHSINRWLVLAFVLLAIGSAVAARSTMNTAPVASGLRAVLPKGALPAFITTHVQLLLGLVLYFGSGSVGSPYVIMDKDAWAAEGGELLRFYSVTHFSYMLAAVIAVTVAYMLAKRARADARAGFYVIVGYGLALVLMLLGIPWPWRDGLQGGWW